MEVSAQSTLVLLGDIIISPCSRDLDFCTISNVLRATFAYIAQNNKERKKHFKNEQSRNAAAKKRANTSGVGI